ncbi:Hsp70 family protein, partial [Streptomyces adelaidensis]|uniref:Hsp70 family protein n=1 Tax=Streptomyces adelaidensis TaxID=2796465 RepID=UPI0019036756
LPKDDIDRMMREAEQHAEEDRRRREATETRNRAEQTAYQTERLLTDNADKIPADVKGEVDSALAELKEALKAGPADGDATGTLRQATDKVTAAAQKVGTAMYAQAQAQAQGRQGATAGAGGSEADAAGQDEDVVDAEIVDDDKGREGAG